MPFAAALCCCCAFPVHAENLPQTKVLSPDKRFEFSYDSVGNDPVQRSWKILTAEGAPAFEYPVGDANPHDLYIGPSPFVLWSPDSKWLAVRLGSSHACTTHLFHLENGAFKEVSEPDPEEPVDNVNISPIAWHKGNRLELDVSWPHAGHAVYHESGKFTVEVSADKPHKLVSKKIVRTDDEDEDSDASGPATPRAEESKPKKPEKP